MKARDAIVSRRPAAITQADVARAIRAAKQAGAAEVEIRSADGSKIVIRIASSTSDATTLNRRGKLSFDGRDAAPSTAPRAPRDVSPRPDRLVCPHRQGAAHPPSRRVRLAGIRCRISFGYRWQHAAGEGRAVRGHARMADRALSGNVRLAEARCGNPSATRARPNASRKISRVPASPGSAWGREQTAVAARAGSISTVSALVSLDHPYRK